MTSGLLFILGAVVGLLVGALAAVLYFGRERSRLSSDAARLQAERDAAMVVAEDQRPATRSARSPAKRFAITVRISCRTPTGCSRR